MKPRRLLIFLCFAASLLAGASPASAFFNPTTGRWLSKDPIEEQGGFNLYSFVANDGINGFDYLGLAEIKINIMRLDYWPGNSPAIMPSSATVGTLSMEVIPDKSNKNTYSTITGYTVEQPEGTRNLYGIRGEAKAYPISAGTYAAA